MRADIRADAVLRELRDDPGERLPAGHRGAGSLRELSDGELLAVVDALVASGKLMRRGHRLRLPEHQPVVLDSEMRERVARLMAGLREAGAEPPRVEGIAARMGIPGGVVAQLRAAGELVQVGQAIDFPRAVAAELDARMDEMARHGPLTVARVRDTLRTSRMEWNLKTDLPWTPAGAFCTNTRPAAALMANPTATTKRHQGTPVQPQGWPAGPRTG